MTSPQPTLPALPKAHEDAEPIPSLSVLYIGPPKSGKTTCALSFPDPFVFYFEPNRAGLDACNPVPPHITAKDLSGDPVQDLTQKILPAIKAGRIKEMTSKPVRTLVFDSLTELLGNHLSKRIRGGKESLDGFDDYGSFLYQAENLVSGQLTPLTAYGFHVVCTVHILDYGNKPIMGKDQRGKLVEIGRTPTERRPGIPGNFRNILCSRFDSVLLTGSEIGTEEVTRIVDGKQVSTRQRAHQYYVETINPDRTYEGIGDGLGRVDGRFNRLPTRLDGRYPSLAKAWGIEK